MQLNPRQAGQRANGAIAGRVFGGGFGFAFLASASGARLEQRIHRNVGTHHLTEQPTAQLQIEASALYSRLKQLARS